MGIPAENQANHRSPGSPHQKPMNRLLAIAFWTWLLAFIVVTITLLLWSGN